MNAQPEGRGSALPPFYGTLGKIVAALDRDVCFRQAWKEFAMEHSEDPAARLVSLLLPLERRTTPVRAERRWRWKW